MNLVQNMTRFILSYSDAVTVTEYSKLTLTYKDNPISTADCYDNRNKPCAC